MNYKKILLHLLFILTIGVGVMLPAGAADELSVIPQRVFSTEAVSEVIPEESAEETLMLLEYVKTDVVPMYTASEQLYEIIRSNEGFTPTKMWDVNSYAIGYGSRYARAEELFGEGIESITEEQAMQLVKADMALIEDVLNSFLKANVIVVNQNQFDALCDLTYNGPGWLYYKNEDGTWCKLRELLHKGPDYWTEEAISEAFGSWVTDGHGNVYPGLVKRRAQDAALFMKPVSDIIVQPEPPAEPESQPDSPTESESGEAPEMSFVDVPASEWYYDSVKSAYDYGLMKGKGDHLFAPLASLSRAEMVQILANLDGADLSAYKASGFYDVRIGEWYTPAIAWAAKMGYVTGGDDGYFRPNDPISREQLCTMLARYLTKKGYSVVAGTLPFHDAGLISSYAWDSVALCYRFGIISGRDDGTFAPQDTATRAEAAAILVRTRNLRW